ncbi:RNase A-like domain-containing protein [Streptomyces sp. NPDC046988]|uniref:RNase A-like domain-containing protein n=1 Tax=Streptomyces sp. NPDC046988 TaxID=3154922 RepID=UPI0033F2819E
MGGAAGGRRTGLGLPRPPRARAVAPVDKTIAGMRKRLREDAGLTADSRYVDVKTAQRFTDKTLTTAENQRKISAWLAKGAKGPLRLEGKFNENTGLHLTRYDFTHGQPTQWVKGVRVILKADPSAPSGYRVLTSFPQP